MSFRNVVAASLLALLCACAPPAAEGVGYWGGQNHQIQAEVSQGDGLAGVVYRVEIDGVEVIRKAIPRADQVVSNGLSFSASGEFRGSQVRAVHEQKATYGQLFVSDKIYIDGELVAVLKP